MKLALVTIIKHVADQTYVLAKIHLAFFALFRNLLLEITGGTDDVGHVEAIKLMCKDLVIVAEPTRKVAFIAFVAHQIAPPNVMLAQALNLLTVSLIFFL